MDWLDINGYGLPKGNERVLTYSEAYRGDPERAFRIMYGQFVRQCIEVTHYIYLREPGEREG